MTSVFHHSSVSFCVYKVLEPIKGQCEDVLASWSRILEFWSSNILNPDLRSSDLGYLRACLGPWSSRRPPAKIMPFWSPSQTNGLGHQSRAQGVFGSPLLCFGFAWQPRISFMHVWYLSIFTKPYVWMYIIYFIVPFFSFPLRSTILHFLWLTMIYGHQKC